MMERSLSLGTYALCIYSAGTAYANARLVLSQVAGKPGWSAPLLFNVTSGGLGLSLGYAEVRSQDRRGPRQLATRINKPIAAFTELYDSSLRSLLQIDRAIEAGLGRIAGRDVDGAGHACGSAGVPEDAGARGCQREGKRPRLHRRRR